MPFSYCTLQILITVNKIVRTFLLRQKMVPPPDRRQSGRKKGAPTLRQAQEKWPVFGLGSLIGLLYYGGEQHWFPDHRQIFFIQIDFDRYC